MRNWIIVIALSIGRAAAADPVVLAVDGPDVYIDLGAHDGVGTGAELELLHEVVAKDPRSGATLRDYFALGRITVVKSGDKVSVARAPEALAKRVLAGDRVRLVSAKRTYVDPWAEQVAATKPADAPEPGAPAVDHGELARAAWQDTLGKAPEQRIERWLALLAADPQTPYKKPIDAEVASLRGQIAARDATLARARSATAGDRNPRIVALAHALAVPASDAISPIALGPVDHVVPDRALPLAFVIRSPSSVDRAWLYVRAFGDPGFHRLDLARDGDAYMRATIPAELVHGSRVEWYVEVGTEGTAETKPSVAPALGSQEEPRAIAIDSVVAEAPVQQGRSHIDVHVDYVDFDGGLAKGYDQYYQAEMDFTYRFIKPIYAVRLGFGTLSGVGGPKDVIDGDMTGHCLDADGNYRCERVTFSYVYTEFEERIGNKIAVMLRPQVGMLTTDTRQGSSMSRCQGMDIAECTFNVGMGLRGRLRIGEETGTNLALGVGFTKGIGTLLEASYHWLPAPVVPVQLAVQVTDQPVEKDFGVRLIGDVGWKQLSWFYPSVRMSYQARSYIHAGVSGGLAMNFDW